MKMKFVILCLSLLSVSISAQAIETKAERKSFSMDQYEEAVKEAKDKGEILGFIYSQRNTTCGLCANATDAFYDELRSKAVFLFVVHDEWEKIPSKVQDTLRKKELGKHIPKMVLFDPEKDAVVGWLGYDEWKKKGEDSLEHVEDELKAHYKAAQS